MADVTQTKRRRAPVTDTFVFSFDLLEERVFELLVAHDLNCVLEEHRRANPPNPLESSPGAAEFCGGIRLSD